MSDVVDGAAITALAGAFATLVSWLMNRDVRRMATRAEKEVERLRSELKRVSELEFKLFTLACESVSESGRALESARRTIVDLVSAHARSEPTEKLDELNTQAVERFGGLRHTAHFLPPDLDKPFDRAVRALRKLVLSTAELSKADRAVRGDAFKKANRQCHVFVTQAREWKRSRWSQYVPLGESDDGAREGEG